MGAPKGSKNALGNKGGRPLKYKTPEELETAIDKYFLDNLEAPTISGLAHYLGFTSRQSIYDYKENQKFSYIIKRAVLNIESKHESNLYTHGSAGSIFWLKNRGWTDKQITEHTGDMIHTIKKVVIK